MIQDRAPLPFAAVCQYWPTDQPLLCLGGRAWSLVLATAFSEVSWDEVRRVPFCPIPGRAATGLSGSGFVGIVSYDHFRPGCREPAPSRWFRVHQALVWDPHLGRFELRGDPDPRKAQHRMAPWAGGDAGAWLASLVSQSRRSTQSPADPANATLELVPLTDAEAYLGQAHRALGDIREGRFYQINLLRYFRLIGDFARPSLARHLDARGGPHAALIEIPGLRLVSWSPERFLRAYPVEGGTVIESCPIKGTAARSTDRAKDLAAAMALQASPKDRAELAMIIDLMRNDLTKVSRSGSVRVPEPLRLESFENVHHLVGRVTSIARPDLTIGDLLLAVSPGGSITGAPKREVMDAIYAYEGRERRYFMGNIIHYDDSGYLDSSILIRTALQEDGQEWEFAAGSGIVMHSDPLHELAEIEAKARVVGSLVKDPVQADGSGDHGR